MAGRHYLPRRLDGLETLQTQRLLQMGLGKADPFEESVRTAGLLEGQAAPLDQTLQLLAACHRSQLDCIADVAPSHRALALYRYGCVSWAV